MHLNEHRNRGEKKSTGGRDWRSLAPASLTDIGLERGVNEDRCAVVHASAAVCHLVLDGMGGVDGGEFAAQLGIDAISRFLQRLDAHQFSDPAECLSAAVIDANRVIALRRQSKTFTQMGTTVVGAVIEGSALAIANVGDSRAYLISEGQIRQLTVDHTYVQMLVDQEEICKEDALTHPQAHILTQCLGASNDVRVDTLQFWIWPPDKGEKPDTLLLCTDGLYSLVHDEEIASVVSSFSPEEACQQLVRMANSRGGYDNITVSVVPLAGTVKDEVSPAWKREVASRERAHRRELWWSMPVQSHFMRAVAVAMVSGGAALAAFFIKFVCR
jgi:serine/threonine protein phosphatase PrpC